MYQYYIAFTTKQTTMKEHSLSYEKAKAAVAPKATRQSGNWVDLPIQMMETVTFNGHR